MLYGVSEQYAGDIVTYRLLYSLWFDLGPMLSFSCKKHKFLFYVCPGYCQFNNFWLIKVFEPSKLNLKN